MRIKYDKNLNLLGIGLVPWTRLGPQIWFGNYKIASLYNWDIDHEEAPQVVALSNIEGDIVLPKLNTQSMLGHPDFHGIMKKHFKNSHVLTYKPVDAPKELEGHDIRFISGDTTLAQSIENKAVFRSLFSPLGIPFPEYRIFDGHSLTVTNDSLANVLGDNHEVVIQDAVLSGGKGTYMVHDNESLKYAFSSLRKLKSGGTIVVSKKVESAHERTVQCVATKYGVFVGPLQKQIVANPLLTNLDVAEGDKFAGIEISNSDTYANAYPEIKKYAETIGKQLIEMGYRGIFGVDCLVNESGKVFVLEVNPRITGATPLLTMLYRDGKDIPFYLLHILELMDAEYEIIDFAIDPIPAEGAMLMVHAHNNKPAKVVWTVQSGLYDGQLKHQSSTFRFDENDKKQVLLQQYIPKEFTVKPGGRTVMAFLNYPVLTESDTLNEDTEKLVKKIQAKIKLEEL